MTPRKLFHYVSYLQYLMIVLALFFVGVIIIADFEGVILHVKEDTFDQIDESFFDHVNLVLVFFGLGISFSTLQDPTTTQNEFSRKIWESPKKGKLFLGLMSFYAVLFIAIGMVGLFTELKVVNEIGLGIIVLGIGMIGQLQVALEMFENHRLDKNPPKKIES